MVEHYILKFCTLSMAAKRASRSSSVVEHFTCSVDDEDTEQKERGCKTHPHRRHVLSVRYKGGGGLSLKMFLSYIRITIIFRVL